MDSLAAFRFPPQPKGREPEVTSGYGLCFSVSFSGRHCRKVQFTDWLLTDRDEAMTAVWPFTAIN